MNKVNRACVLLLAIFEIASLVAHVRLVDAQDIVVERKKVVRRKTQSDINTSKAPAEVGTMWHRSHKGGKGKGSSKPKYTKFEATIASKDDEYYEDLSGWVKVEEDGSKLRINYHIRNGPEECDKCRISIHNGRNCNHIRRAFYDRSKHNPWTNHKAKLITNDKGRAAGFMKVKNGRYIEDHECKLAVIFEEVEYDDDTYYDDDGDGYYYDDGRRDLLEVKPDQPEKRELHFVPKGVIGCGYLVPLREDADFCDDYYDDDGHVDDDGDDDDDE